MKKFTDLAITDQIYQIDNVSGKKTALHISCINREHLHTLNYPGVRISFAKCEEFGTVYRECLTSDYIYCADKEKADRISKEKTKSYINKNIEIYKEEIASKLDIISKCYEALIELDK